jgi:hypothetical protein
MLYIIIIISLYAPEARINTRESTYSKTRTGTRIPSNKATAKKNAAKTLYESCFFFFNIKFSGRCYANDPQGSSMQDAN